jgi:DNA-binding XRE family transcriptional regulator
VEPGDTEDQLQGLAPGIRTEATGEIEPKLETSMKKIKTLREQRGLTQEELARRARISPVTLIYLEQDGYKRGTPTIGTLQKIAAALDVKVPELIGEE